MTKQQIILERLAATPGEFVWVWELFGLAKSVAVHSIIDRLREKGHRIERRVGRDEFGRSRSEYRLLGTGPPHRDAPVPGRRRGGPAKLCSEKKALQVQGEFALDLAGPSMPTRSFPD